MERFARKLRHAGTRVYFTGARLAVRRTLLQAGLTQPHVLYASSVEEALADWRAPQTVVAGSHSGTGTQQP